MEEGNNAISTTIYIYGDKPEYYLHGNRLQYVQSWDKAKKTKKKTTGSKLKLTGAKKLHTVHVNSPEEAWGDLAETQIFSGAWKLSSNKDWPPTEYSC